VIGEIDMPLRLKTTRLWTLVLAAVLVAGTVSAMVSPQSEAPRAAVSLSAAI